MYKAEYHGECDFIKYIVELVMVRRAKKEGRILGQKFWNSPEWKMEYIKQTRAAHKLSNLYDDVAILSVLKNGNIYSLSPRWVSELIYEEVGRRDAANLKRETVENMKVKEVEETNYTPKMRKARGKKED